MNIYDIDLYVLLGNLGDMDERQLRAYLYLQKLKGISSEAVEGRLEHLHHNGCLRHGCVVTGHGVSDIWAVTDDGVDWIGKCMKKSSSKEIRILSSKHGVLKHQLYIIWRSLPYALFWFVVCEGIFKLIDILL